MSKCLPSDMGPLLKEMQDLREQPNIFGDDNLSPDLDSSAMDSSPEPGSLTSSAVGSEDELGDASGDNMDTALALADGALALDDDVSDDDVDDGYSTS